MELQRNINNKNYLFCFITVISCFVFGYILPISIDHVNALTLYDYFNSVYTVITQFGPLVFSLVIIYVINTDYKEKNILFYSSILLFFKSSNCPLTKRSIFALYTH